MTRFNALLSGIGDCKTFACFQLILMVFITLKLIVFIKCKFFNFAVVFFFCLSVTKPYY